MRASQRLQGTDKYYALFDNFIQLFKTTGDGYDESYLEDKNSTVRAAYWRWMTERKAEIRPIPPKPVIPAGEQTPK